MDTHEPDGRHPWLRRRVTDMLMIAFCSMGIGVWVMIGYAIWRML